MKRALIIATATVVLVLALAVPAFARTSGAGGAGESFGVHHATMAQDMKGFTGEMNPGVHHQGFSNWDPGMTMP